MIVEKFRFFSSIPLDVFIILQIFLFDIIWKIFIINLYIITLFLCVLYNASSSMDYTYPCCIIPYMVV